MNKEPKPFVEIDPTIYFIEHSRRAYEHVIPNTKFMNRAISELLKK